MVNVGFLARSVRCLLIPTLLVSLTGCGRLAVGWASTDLPLPPGSQAQSSLLEGSACRATYSADRCQALTTAAEVELGTAHGTIRVLRILPNPSPDGIDFGHRTFLGVELADGSIHSVVIVCPGIAAAYEPQCMDAPRIPLGGPTGDGAGYRDVPGDATPLPTLEPDAIAAAVPLRIGRLEVPIKGTGPQRVVVGRASLPNGVLSQGNFQLEDPWPSSVAVRDSIQLEVRSLKSGALLSNYYDHGWRKGTEEVEASITFDVLWSDPEASITLKDLIVR